MSKYAVTITHPDGTVENLIGATQEEVRILSNSSKTINKQLVPIEAKIQELRSQLQQLEFQKQAIQIRNVRVQISREVGGIRETIPLTVSETAIDAVVELYESRF